MCETRQYKFTDEDIQVIESSLLKHMHFLQLHGKPDLSRYVYNLIDEINFQQKAHFSVDNTE
jgi:hypothetical protein